MTAQLNIILPVFLVVAFGYGAAWRGLFSESAVDGLMRFAQSFAVPCLLFTAISRIDLGNEFNLPLLISFYVGAFAGFGLGYAGARWLFDRSPTDSVAIGFCGLFSNSLLLGLPITERAYGVDALAANYAIIALHAPLLYAFGVIAMELVRGRSGQSSAGPVAIRVLVSLARNPLVIGIFLGFLVNVTGLPLPHSVSEALDMMVRAALPAALFGLGGVLFRYRPEGDSKTIAWITAVSLVAHPTITYGLGRFAFDLSTSELRSAVMTAAMAPGVNTYLFANMYGVAKRVAASSVLIATALSILTIWIWLSILP